MSSPPSTTARKSVWRRAIALGAILSLVGAILYGLTGAVFVAGGVIVVAVFVLEADAWARRRFQPRGAVSLPTLGFIAWGLLPTLIAILGLASGPVSRGDLTLLAFVVMWWGVAILLVRGVLTAIVPALGLIALPCYYMIGRTVRRVEFVIREGGMERADGYGSPALFAANWAMELGLVVVPLVVVGARLLWALRREWLRRGDLTVSALPRSSR